MNLPNYKLSDISQALGLTTRRIQQLIKEGILPQPVNSKYCRRLFVSTDYLSGNFIELLRNKMLVRQMGAKVMSGLHGDIVIPKQMGGATAFWVAEGDLPQKSQQTFGQVTLSPKSIAAYT